MSIGPALRVGVFRIGADGSMVPATPDYVYAEGSEGTIARTIIDSTPSDQPGYRLALVRLDTPIFGLIADASRARTVVIGYSRGPKGMDQRVPIDFSVVDTNILEGKVVRTRSQVQGQEFEKCFTRLVMAVPPAK